MPSHPYVHTPVTRRVVITHDIVDGVDRVTGVALEADPGEQLPDVDLTAWAGAFTVETSLVGDEREVILRFPDCGAEHVPAIERRRLCQPGGRSVTSRRAFQGEDHSDGQESPRPIDPADIRPGDVVERRDRFTVKRIDEDGLIESSSGWCYSPEGEGWHLVHRPDPDAEAVEALAKLVYDISHPDADDLEASREALRDLREQGWDVVRRAES